jgi:hypothetical protein
MDLVSMSNTKLQLDPERLEAFTEHLLNILWPDPTITLSISLSLRLRTSFRV